MTGASKIPQPEMAWGPSRFNATPEIDHSGDFLVAIFGQGEKREIYFQSYYHNMLYMWEVRNNSMIIVMMLFLFHSSPVIMHLPKITIQFQSIQLMSSTDLWRSSLPVQTTSLLPIVPMKHVSSQLTLVYTTSLYSHLHLYPGQRVQSFTFFLLLIIIQGGASFPVSRFGHGFF